MPTRFRWPEVEVKLSDVQVDALRRELDALAETPRFARAAPNLRDRYRPGVVVDREQLSMPELVTLVRALDHLRNAGELEREGQRVRDAMRTAAISYRLRVGRGHEEANFRGYGGMYEIGDRLVATSEDALRVVSIEEPEDGPTVLSCERWRRRWRRLAAGGWSAAPLCCEDDADSHPDLDTLSPRWPWSDA